MRDDWTDELRIEAEIEYRERLRLRIRDLTRSRSPRLDRMLRDTSVKPPPTDVPLDRWIAAGRRPSP